MTARRDFTRVVVVNRGEPALRFVHAAHELSHQGSPLRTIALFTEPDRQALYVREADESYELGPARSADAQGRLVSPYLDHARLERVLVDTRAEAAWVGWGFVSEQAAFAELCERLGVAFIGPSAAAMRRLGDKIAAKRLAEEAGVPVATWSGGPVESAAEARRQADRIGYPLIVKAAAGGGGRGIRKVVDPSTLEQAFAAAQSEARLAFGDPTVYLERLLEGVRHVEAQVVADAFGAVWFLGVRDCTLQRRNQKIVEESPCPALSPERERAIGQAAVCLARAGGYENAGTVEFLLEPATGAFWFMEVNTRLQVEHPVTEAVTGLDLVKLQVLLARGGRLEGEPPLARGHAVEARLCAEDPEHGFAPAPGTVVLLRWPHGPGVRVDAGLQEGDAVPAEFDSMIAKIIAHGQDRNEAMARLRRALRQCTVVMRDGTTNLPFLVDLLGRPAVREARFDVSWLDRLMAQEGPRERPGAEIALARAAMDAYEVEVGLERARFLASAAAGRPEVGREIGRTIELRHGGQTYRVEVRRLGPNSYQLELDGRRLEAGVERLGGMPARERRAVCSQWRLRCGGHSHRTSSLIQGLVHLVDVDGVPHSFTRDHQGLVRSPAPAMVVSVAVKPGDSVAVGDPLLVLEAMKLETSVVSPLAGHVREVCVGSNVQVGTGAPLVIIEADLERTPAPVAERIRFAGDEPRAADTPAGSRRRVLAHLRQLMLGLDFELTELKPRLIASRGWCGDGGTAGTFAEEAKVLEVFADLCSLFRRQPAAEEGGDEVRLSTEEYFFNYLRNLDARGAGLPAAFVQKLQRALAQYGVGDLARSPELEESLFRLCKSHQREEDYAAVVFELLDCCLERHPCELGSAAAGFRDLLDRLIAESNDHCPSVVDLAREVRYRYFEQPLLEDARNRVYAEVEQHFACLSADPPAEDRRRRLEALVACPQPLAGLLSGRFHSTGPLMRQVILEVLVRRFYRIRALRDLRTLLVDDHSLATAQYDHQGKRIHVVTAHAAEEDLPRVVPTLCRLTAEIAAEHDVVIDLFVWRSAGLGDAEEAVASLRAILDAAGFARPIRRLVVALAGPTAGRAAGTQWFTLRQSGGAFHEERVYRGLHPMMAKRLQMQRLARFDLERLPSVEDVYVIRGVARENRRDERLFVMAEVRDLTPIHDGAGRVVELPQLERMLLEALGGIRRFQARRPPGQRLYGNRILLYIWPPFDFKRQELNALLDRLAPAAEGLGIEVTELRVRLPVPEGGTREALIQVSSVAGRGTVARLGEPRDDCVEPLGEYEERVGRLAQHGLVHPYEIIRMLTPPSGELRSQFPPGSFTEYDLDAQGRLAPVVRAAGGNQANVVVGLIRSFTSRYPEGMSRVILLGDPSRELGSLAESECRRILGALDLAEREALAVDWIALSAGAKISMESGTENMDWIARVLRRIVLFTQRGGEVNVVVNGINVGAQPYWDAEATMLMHTRGILVMTPDSAMVLTGKRALDYSGGVSAEDNQGIGGHERVMGPNGEAQYFARDLADACRILIQHHEHTYVAPGERFPRRAESSDPCERDVCDFPYAKADGLGFAVVGDVLSDEKNPGRKRPFDMRCLMAAVVDGDLPSSERWLAWQDAETVVVWDAYLGGYSVCLLGIESHPMQRLGFIPADGPDRWTAGTLFPQSSRKLARALNAASGNRPVVILANLTGFDGSPESLRRWQLEYGAEIGRAVVNFDGPIVFCVVSRYHGGAFVVFSAALNEHMRVVALEGTYASVIGGAPAAAVVFSREVDRRVSDDARIRQLEGELSRAEGGEKARARARLRELTRIVHAEKLREVADEFDGVHTIHRARRVGSVHDIIPPSALRPYLIAAVAKGMGEPVERGGAERVASTREPTRGAGSASGLRRVVS